MSAHARRDALVPPTRDVIMAAQYFSRVKSLRYGATKSAALLSFHHV